MGPLALAGIGAGLGFLKGQLVDKPRERKDREVAAETIRYSPWTGMSPQGIRQADTFGNVLQGGMTGATLGQGMEAQKLYQEQLAQQALARQIAASQATAVPLAMNYSPWQGLGNV